MFWNSKPKELPPLKTFIVEIKGEGPIKVQSHYFKVFNHTKEDESGNRIVIQNEARFFNYKSPGSDDVYMTNFVANVVAVAEVS